MDVVDSSNQNLLPSSDQEFLTNKDYEFEVLEETGKLQLVIKNFSLPKAYQPQNVNILIEIPPGYPNAQLDMFWTYPEVKLLNGNLPLTSQHHQTFHGNSWQRWSRHLTSAWRPGIDNLRTFLTAIRKELNKGI